MPQMFDEAATPTTRTLSAGWPLVIISAIIAMALNVGFLKLMSSHPVTVVKVCLAGVELLLIVFILASAYAGSKLP